MDALQEFLDQLLEPGEWNEFPSWVALQAAMDPVAWTMVLIVLGSVCLGGLYSLLQRRTGGMLTDADSRPEALLERVKRDPASLAPAAMLQRIGAEGIRELLEFGDAVDEPRWRSQWVPVREELLRLMSAQHAFAAFHALTTYYRCTDRTEPATVRIRRTALIHKLGQRRSLPSGPDQARAQLLVFTDGQEPVGELGFAGRIHWLKPEHRPQVTDGPMVELDPISFHSLQKATMKVRIYRSLLTGAGFRLHFSRFGEDWIITKEELEWAR